MKKTMTLLMATGVLLSAIGGATAFADETSTVNATVTAGTFGISKPNDVSFNGTLNGTDQTVTLKDKIKTTVSDYRGVEEGWDVTVKSSNYDTYKDNFVLSVDDKAITATAVTVATTKARTQKADLSLETKVMISATAKAGTFDASLEWALSPNTESLSE